MHHKGRSETGDYFHFLPAFNGLFAPPCANSQSHSATPSDCIPADDRKEMSCLSYFIRIAMIPGIKFALQPTYADSARLPEQILGGDA